MSAAEHTIAVVGLVHSHVWGHLNKMIQGKPAKLVGVAETEPVLTAEAQRRGVPADLISADWKKMIDEKKPEIVWAFVENNRHREIVEYCAPRKIHVLFEKPLASTYKDAVAIRDLAVKNGIYVMSNYQMAWWPANHVAKGLADSGALGKIYRIRGVVGHGGPGGPTGLNKFFFDWLTDPVKNGGGALVDFGCYNALWSLMYLGRPETVYAQTNQLRPAEFPKVEDNATIILNYKQATAILEGSWDLPRSFQDLEVFGREGSLYMTNGKVETRKGREPVKQEPLTALAPEAAEPIAAMIHSIETKSAPQGMTAIDINVGVVEIIEAAKESVRTGKAVRLK
ncbi:MAG: Gfo/Idh/MocA family oxidoreductase [Bryobacterales bacterium]|nr:Gfo/Idh/MocA family oxidoreductase [Bryobacterales bacterium]